MDKQWHVLGTITYYAFYISRTITGMELTGQMTDCKNSRPVWNYKAELFKIFQPFRTFGSRWSHCEIQGKDSFQAVHPEKTQTFRHQNVQTTWLYRIYIWHDIYLVKDRQKAAQHLTATHNTVANLTRGVEGFGYKLYMDNFFPPLTYMMTWPRRKFSVVGQLGYIERACPRTSNPRHLDWNVVTFE